MSGHALQAQAPREFRLKPANGQLKTEFVNITSVRELQDGRVLVSDSRSRTLLAGDFKDGSVNLIGRKGRGPGEFLNVGFLYGLAGDSTVMNDSGQRRWVIVVGDRIVDTRPSDDPVVRAVGVIQGADVNGNVLATRGEATRPGERIFTRADSQEVVLAHRGRVSIDTIARIREMPHRMTAEFNSEGRLTSFRRSRTEPNAQPEEALLAHDGTLWILRQDPVRVDTRDPSGKWTLGAPIPIKGDAIDASERRAIDSMNRDAAIQLRKLGLPPRPATAIAAVSPLLDDAYPRDMLDGRIFLNRKSSLSSPSVRYLVINKRGGVDGQITLKRNEYLVGFGPRSIYIAAKDEDDIVRLRRHPWP